MAAEEHTQQLSSGSARWVRWAWWLLGATALALGCFLFGAWLAFGLSWYSGALASAGLVLAAGLLRQARQPGRGCRLQWLGLALVVGLLLGRGVLVGNSQRVQLLTLPGNAGPRWVSRLYPESDGMLVAANLLQLAGSFGDPEAPNLASILGAACRRAQPSIDRVPTPAIATYLGLQSADRFDTVVIHPQRAQHQAPNAVVFLHGHAGNFSLYCREFAEAAAAANLITLCPSVGPDGAWWEAQGAATLERTLAYARQQGARRVYLAGLSKGAAGASVLAHEHQRQLAGLILISGILAKRPPSLPVLVVHGQSDGMFPPAAARSYAALSEAARYHEVVGGHFIFLSRYQQVRPVIAAFLKELEQNTLDP